jgi:hypothetical protein
MTPINADALNHMEAGIEAANSQRLWKQVTYSTTVPLTDDRFTMDAKFPAPEGYTRMVTNIKTASSNQWITGWYVGGTDGETVTLRLHNDTSSTSVTVVCTYEYYSNDNQWT